MVSSSSLSNHLHILRQIISELRFVIPKTAGTPLSNNLTLRYILKQYRKHYTTDEQLCKSREEMKFMANTYLCYLRSSRLHKEINEEFHGKGERSVGETASMLGFKLPHDPK